MTPQEEIRFRQMIANQMSAPRNPLEEAARFKGLLPNPYARGLRPPTDAERERFDATNPEMPLNGLALARLEAERLARLESERLSGAPTSPFPPGFDVRPPDYGRFPTPTPPSPPDYRIRPTPDYSTPEYANAKAAWFANPRNEGRIYKEEYAFNDPGEDNFNYLGGSKFFDESAPYAQGAMLVSSDPTREEIEYRRRESERLRALRDANLGVEMATAPEPEEYDGFVDSGTGRRGFMGGKWMPTPLPPIGGEVATAPEPEEYDGFVDSGTGRRSYLDFKYMPTPMDTSVTMAQAAPPVASTAYNAPPVASTAYMPPPTDAPVNTAYNAPPVANTAYMPSRRTVPVDTTYRPPAQANTTYMPSSAPTYGMSSTPSYSMSNAQTTTPTYGGQIREPSYSPNQAGKYKVDGPRLKNTGGLFNDLNAFFGRPQT